MPSRRRILQSLSGVGISVLVAGCTGDNDDENSGTPTNTAAATRTPTATPAPTETEENEADGDEGNGNEGDEEPWCDGFQNGTSELYFELGDSEMVVRENDVVVKGTLENITDTVHLRDLRVYASVYDDNGNVITSDGRLIRNLSAGDTWEYWVVMYVDPSEENPVSHSVEVSDEWHCEEIPESENSNSPWCDGFQRGAREHYFELGDSEINVRPEETSVVGTLTNITENISLHDVRVYASIYNEEGHVIDSSGTLIRNLSAGDTWGYSVTTWLDSERAAPKNHAVYVSDEWYCSA